MGVNTVILVLAADADKTRAINRNYKQVGPNPEAALPSLVAGDQMVLPEQTSGAVKAMAAPGAGGPVTQLK